MFLRRIALAVLATAAAVSGLLAQTTTTTTTRDLSVGPVGVGTTETLQVNVANLASNPTNGGTAASCTGTITLNNTSGNAIGTSTPFTLTAGQISSVSFPFAKISTGTSRTEVIGVIGLTTTSGTRAPCELHFSLETYDTTTGATHIYISGSDGAALLGGGPGRS